MKTCLLYLSLHSTGSEKFCPGKFKFAPFRDHTVNQKAFFIFFGNFGSLFNLLLLSLPISLFKVYQSKVFFFFLGDFPDPGIEPGSLTLEADALTSEPPGKNFFFAVNT